MLLHLTFWFAMTTTNSFHGLPEGVHWFCREEDFRCFTSCYNNDDDDDDDDDVF